jgi:serine/threonine-protein kinase
MAGRFADGATLGQYRILSLLGKGGMGEVYLAEDTRLGRKIALKLLSEEFTRDAERVRRFEQEASAASALNHPNILTIHDIGRAGDVHFIATEFIDGATLRQRMHGGSLTLRETLDIATQAAGALAAAHAGGIVHRDVKPENIMLRRDGYLKVVDFGLAKLTERMAPGTEPEAVTVGSLVATDPGRVMGTVQYMSPEQARGLQVDERTDLFSLGAVLYEMVAGRAPFGGATTTDIIVSILQRDPEPLAKYAAGVPEELERIVAKSLAKDREERYQTAKDFLIDLKRLKQKPETDTELARSTSAPVATTSSAEYVVGEVKRHKGAMAAAVAVLALASSWFYFRGGHKTVESLAVLPFANVTADPNAEYLSDGLTESIISSLSQLPRLTVMSRNSVFRYKGKDTDAQKAAQDLKVDAVLTGRLTRRGDNLAVSVELVDARNNSQIWGEQYNRKLADLQAVEGEISREISEKLKLKLTGEQKDRLAKRSTQNAEAHRLYLQGRYYFYRVGEDQVRKGIDFFNQAIEKDPGYAAAYAGLADSYWALSDWYFPPREAMPKAKEAARKALALDDKLAEGHTSMALIRMNYDWDWAAAERDFQRAMELSPGYALAPHQYGWLLAYTGRLDESLVQFRRAQQLDPLSLLVAVDMNLPFYFKRQHEQALEGYRKALEMDPNFFLSHIGLGINYAVLRRLPEAVAAMDKAMALENQPFVIGNAGYAYGLAGKTGEARKLLDELKQRARQRYVSSQFMAQIHLGLGEKDLALQWLEKAFEERSIIMPWLKLDPMFDPLRKDPRFVELVRKVGFP